MVLNPNEDYELVYLESASSLDVSRSLSHRRSEPTQIMTAIGINNAFETGIPDLAAAVQEVNSIKKISAFQSAGVFVQEQSVLPNLHLSNGNSELNEALESSKIIHFATHGTADNTEPQLTGIHGSAMDTNGIQQDNFLTAQEISYLNLSAELVVIAGCEVGSSKILEGEGGISISRSFEYAGVPRSITALWVIDDPGTALFSQIFYTYLGDGYSPTESLKRAQTDMITTAGVENPFYWAVFKFRGDWQWS